MVLNFSTGGEEVGHPQNWQSTAKNFLVVAKPMAMNFLVVAQSTTINFLAVASQSFSINHVNTE